MDPILSIIKGTPSWVWMVFIYVLFVGIKSTRTRIVYLPKLFIIPLVLLALKYKIFFSKEVVLFIAVIIFAAICSFIALRHTKITVIKNAKSVELPGNYSTLLTLICFFAIKYYFGYLDSTMPTLSAKYSFIDTIISGIFTGYFLGRSIRYLREYMKASVKNLKSRQNHR